MNFTPSRNFRALFFNCFVHLKRNNYTTRSSQDLRNEFLNFFMQKHNHEYVRSSPVVPFCDPTVPFVNAGMNQFKGIFLGKFSPPHPRVTNSQKCVRVSGKHNDIDIVGTDGHHHTFFEMLGNWSFGDYYKTEACRMAWELLTGPYGFEKKDLIITYFGGDKVLGLPADTECRDIWLNIGIHPDNLIASSFQDNFWEMGSTGPCGPCTEIHYRDTFDNILEIWNIVFIQFHRQIDGIISPLPKVHIDTGMGLERITALLQNKKSNYDTDLFMPIIKAIHKESKNVPMYQGKFGIDAVIDNSYRILADHARMVSICLADGVFPCRNLRLRNVLRKAITISKTTFQHPDGMMVSLYDRVCEILGETYPELYSNMNSAKQIIIHEEHTLSNLQLNIGKDRKALIEKYPECEMLPDELMPGLSEGYRQFKEQMKSIKDGILPGHMAFKLYDTFGIDQKTIFTIAQINKLKIDMKSFETHLADHKSKHKAIFSKAADMNISNILSSNLSSLSENNLSQTEDLNKYDYCIEKGQYIFPKLKSKLIAILTDSGDLINSIRLESQNKYHLIFDKTNFYCEEGGQEQDLGDIILENNVVFEVETVSSIQGFILHTGKFKKSNDVKGTFDVGNCVELSVNSENRISTMQHHTATHLLNAVVKHVLPENVTCQLGSRVNSSGLVLDLAVYGTKLTSDIINKATNLIRYIATQNIPVKTRVINVQELLSVDNVTTVPGEVYPDTNLRLVEINIPKVGITSRELCCGTHVLSTADIKDFTITSIRGAGGHAPVIRAVVGKLASQVMQLKEEAKTLCKEFDDNEITDRETIQERIKKIKTKLNEICKGDGAPYGTRLDCLEILSFIEKRMKEENDKAILELVQEEMRTLEADADENNKSFMIHFLACSYLLQPGTLSLTMAVQCVSCRPVLVIGCANGILKATCKVPHTYVTNDFNAEKWMNSIIPVFGTYVIPATKNQDIQTIAHMKGKKVSLINCEALVGDAIEKGNEYAKMYCKNYDSNKNDKKWLGKLNEKVNHSN